MVNILYILLTLTGLGLGTIAYFILKQYKVLNNPFIWEQAIVRFENEDRQSQPPKGAILFLGGSNVKNWQLLERELIRVPVLDRSFGGARISDIINYANRIIYPYEPKAIILFGGINEITDQDEGKGAEDILNDFQELAERIRLHLPKTDLYFLPIIPTTSHYDVWPKANMVNELIKEYCRNKRKLHFLHATNFFLTKDGLPDEHLLHWDGVHPNHKGYKILSQVIKYEVVNKLYPELNNMPKLKAHFLN